MVDATYHQLDYLSQKFHKGSVAFWEWYAIFFLLWIFFLLCGYPTQIRADNKMLWGESIRWIWLYNITCCISPTISIRPPENIKNI